MRAGTYTVHQSLTAEAAAVLKLSLNLARRRGHAQVTPLHVAYTLLGASEPSPSPPSSLSPPQLFTTIAASTPTTPAYGLLMRACARSRSPQTQTHHHHHAAQCRALELCFNIALNRLPTANNGSSPPLSASLLHQPCPTLSNALVAALKRAQANQRRGCVELQTQPPPPPTGPGPQQQPQQAMVTIKVELDQLIVSILDDPTVSRVMREAGFSSSAVKSSLEEETTATATAMLHGSSSTPPPSCYSTAPPFFLDPYAGGAAGFPAHSSAVLWAANFMNHPPPPTPSSPCNKARQDDVRAILEVMTRRVQGQGRRRGANPVVVGDSVSVAEACVAELMRRMERGGGDVPDELRGARVLRLHLSHVHVRLMAHADVDAWTADLRRTVAAATGTDKADAGLVIYVGDMSWAVDDDSPGGFSSSPGAARLAAEIGRLLGELRQLRGGRAWLVAAASYGTFMRCQRSSSSLEVAWDLQPVAVAVPAGGGLDLELGGPRARAASQADSKATQPPQFPLLDLALTHAPEEGDSVPMPTLCAECAEYYESEASAVAAKAQGTNLALTFFPGWPQADEPQTSHKDDLMELKRKWSRLCQLRVHSFHGRSKMEHQDVKTTLSLLPDSGETSGEEPDAAAAAAPKPRGIKNVVPWLSTGGELPDGDLKRKAESVRMPSDCESAKRWKGRGGLDLNLNLSADDEEDGGIGSSEDELVPSDLTNDDGEEARGDVTDSLDNHCQAAATFDH